MVPYRLTASEAARSIAGGKLSSEELVRSCLDRILARDSVIRAWAFLDPKLALRQARNCDRYRGKCGPLHGVPVGIKDIIDTADMPTAYNSRIYREHRPKHDAECVVRLRDAGAVILGKTKTSEFAHLTPADTRNPYDLSRTPGGSSSGSAAAVADSMVPLSLGTQTGGSTIRPASYCGVFAFKPTFWRISTRGVKSLAASFDTMGLIARDIGDLAMLDRVLADRRALGSRMSKRPIRIGYCRTPFWSSAEPSTRKAMRNAATALNDAGHTVTSVKLSNDFIALNEGFSTLCAAEAAWSMDRELHEHGNLLSTQFRRFLHAGRTVTPDQVQRVRAAMMRCAIEMDHIFNEFDALLTPAAPGEAELGNAVGNNEFNRIWTMIHLPCLTIPSAMGPNSMPVGVQLIGRRGADGILLAAGRRIATTLLS